MSLGSILDLKELSQTYQPLLLCEFTFNSGNILRVSTHALSTTFGGANFNGYEWLPRVMNQDITATQAMSDLGVDIVPQVQVVMADPDKTIYQGWEAPEGFKGTILKIYSIMWDASNPASTGSFSSDSPVFVKFIGTCSASSFDDRTLTVTAVSLLNLTQTQMPPFRIQPLCGWTFPPTQDDRSAALSLPDSPFFRCGYSYGIPGGVGNPETGTAAFTSCDLSFQACVDRLGHSTDIVPIEHDQFGNITGRFGGYEYIPPSTSIQRPYLTGKWEEIVNSSNQAKYGDFVPLCYGTTWVEPLVMGTWGDGNFTYAEILLCADEIDRIHTFVVNGVQIPRIARDNDSNHVPIDSDSLTSDLSNGYWVTVNKGIRNGNPNPAPGWGRKGDPYGSVAAVYFKVLRQLADSNTVPSVQVLLDGSHVRSYSDINTYTTAFSRNPAWIMMDVLVKCGWRYADINVQSFIDAATKCDAQIFFNRMDGAYADFYSESGNPIYNRFSVGLTVRQRTAAGELLRGLRASMKAMLFFDFQTGLLTLRIKETIASQQPNPIPGSNFPDLIDSVTVEGVSQQGYIAYAFDHTNIAKAGTKSTLNVYQKSNQESANKVTIPIQNRENAYSQDSATIVDIEDVSRIGTEIFGSFPIQGIQTFDHARRITGTWFAENFRGNGRLDYQGSFIGDTGGTLFFEFQTSVKVIHLMVGDICLLSDQQLGIDEQTIRILRIQPATNFETVSIVATWHNDNWYQDTFGQANQPIYGNAQGLPDRPPFSWRPDFEIPMSGDALYDRTDHGFGVGLDYSFAADGSIVATLLLTGKVPVNAFDPSIAKPKLEILGVGTSSVGGYQHDTSFWVAVAEKGSASLLSPLSDSVLVPTGPDDNSLEAIVHSWPRHPTGYVAFAGTNPLAMSFQQESTTANPAVLFLDNSPYNSASWEPPDEVFSKFQFKVSKIRHVGIFETPIPYEFDGSSPVGDNFAKLSVYENFGLPTASFAGREAVVLALSARTAGVVSTPIPIANFPISDNNEDTLFFSAGFPTACVSGTPLMSGDIFAIRNKFTYGSDSVGSFFEDDLFINPLNQIYDRRLVSSASNETPIRIIVDLSDGGDFPYQEGDHVVIQEVQGNRAANGGFTISNVDPDTNSFMLDGSSGNGDYIKGGWVAEQEQGLIPGEEAGNIAMFVAGTGRGSYVKISDNTQTRCYISGDWPVVPDDTTRLTIIEPVPLVEPLSAVVRNAVRELLTTQTVDLRNYDKISLFIQVGMQSFHGRVSPYTFDPFREIHMIGSPLVQDIPGAAPFQVRAEGYAVVTVINLTMDDNAYAIEGLNFLMPSVDETDVGLWWQGSVTASIDPAVVSFAKNNGSRFGTEIRPGDFIMWRDPGQYEINKFRGYDDVGNAILDRQDPLAQPGTAFFGTPITDHSLRRIYRVIPKMFPNHIRQNALGVDGKVAKLPDQWDFPWANKCVLAVVSQPDNSLGFGPTYNLPLTPGSSGYVSGFGSGQNFMDSPMAPGMRTLNGSSYILGAAGALSDGQTADFRIQIEAPHSLRCVKATISAPVNHDVVVHVMSLPSNIGSPDYDPVQDPPGLIDTVVIKKGSTSNWDDATQPKDRWMPYHADGWVLEQDWPPNELPRCFGSVDSNNKLILPINPTDELADNMILDQDMFLDFVIALASDSSDLVITVQV